MECPFCSNVMEEGKFMTGLSTGTVWVPKDTKRPFLNFTLRKIEESGGMILSDHFNLRDGYSLTAHICRTCKRGVFTLEDSNAYPLIL